MSNRRNMEPKNGGNATGCQLGGTCTIDSNAYLAYHKFDSSSIHFAFFLCSL